MIPTYLTVVLSVATAMAKPAQAMSLLTVVCHVRSLKRPEECETTMLMMPARMYGGHVRTNVIVVLYLRVLTTLCLQSACYALKISYDC